MKKNDIGKIREIALKGTCELSQCNTCPFDNSCYDAIISIDEEIENKFKLGIEIRHKAQRLLDEIEFDKEIEKHLGGNGE